jgi:hypothetical protein
VSERLRIVKLAENRSVNGTGSGSSKPELRDVTVCHADHKSMLAGEGRRDGVVIVTFQPYLRIHVLMNAVLEPVITRTKWWRGASPRAAISVSSRRYAD